MKNGILCSVLLAVMALVCCGGMMAAPAKPHPFVHVQSDGSTVTLNMQGGKFNHCLVTMDGFPVELDAQGDYCYLAGGMLSNMRAHDAGHRGIEEMAFITAYRDQMCLSALPHRVPRREDGAVNTQVPTLGSPRIPIILVNYTDVHFIDADPITTFENQFNAMDYSCLHYFQDQSRGKFSPQFDILGPVQLPNDRAYYGANVGGYDAQLGTMIYEGCQGVAADVDFTRYDNDGDGYVDVVVVLFAGVGEAQAWQQVPESVWPCQWDMQECYEWGYSVCGPFQLNGATIDKFAVFNELEGYNNSSTNIDGVGTFCHEFSQCLGLPDFYKTTSGSVYGMSNWDLMDHGCYLNNGYTPVGYTSYERHFMGWMDLIDPVENTQYMLAPLNTVEGTAVKVTNDANPDEYYLLEYRTKTGWDKYIAGEGIMVLHVDYDKEAWDNNTPNNNAHHPRMTLIPADNMLSGYTNSTDLWPQGDLDSLTNYSIPAAEVYTGGYMNKPITGMAVDNDTRTASFWYMQAPQVLPGDVNGDGEVNIADINAIINAIMTGQTVKACDVNGDSEVNIADINAVISIILHGE
ncbi:MAG: M6 family metalloprotease domain-containing protein [Muribaculaceae bacterium]|nr:M6 family metalloprotease domain-containing protein [Muribaculaceae bacterium]